MKLHTIASACAALLLAAVVSAQASERTLAVRARTLHTQAGPPIEDGIVLIVDGKIRAVGPASTVTVPDGVRVLSAAVAVPGLVDAHTCVGLAGWLNHDHDKDEVDRSGIVQPELRALDAYNPSDPLVGWLRGFGITTVHTGHAPLALISGQTMIVKTRGNTVEEAVLVPEAMVAATLADSGRGPDGAGTRAKAMATLRQHLLDGKRHAEALAKAQGDPEAKAPDRDLRKEALARVVSGRTPLLVTVHRAQDIASVLRLRAEFPDLRLVLDGVAEAPSMLAELIEADLPILVHPTMYRAGGETKNLSMETPRVLVEAGLRVALQSGYEGYVPRTRVVLHEAAIAARYGLSFERALGLVTIDAARLLGVEARVGSLEVGKDGDVALFDGDPFEYTSSCIGTVIEGELVSEGERRQ